MLEHNGADANQGVIADGAPMKHGLVADRHIVANAQRLAGVTVQLRDATSGGVLATRITNSTGQYVFSSSDDDLAPLRAYIVSIGLDQAPLARLKHHWWVGS